ncbi:helix-turn-helix transcriptional regulator [Nocardia farcinica]|jgi:transcriptional regulator with XRE-family HTH domain|uniref:helix-turn-helix domain-containing protein n=2 Tax=Nocardia TaxID=1817 RepID=UPI0002ECDBC9|nr:helix-turn-helix transcriptional regulator [Nocardia farcinica]MBF6588460.1 helix-turn-helix transcriptional regulator [Nocardia farcinica]
MQPPTHQPSTVPNAVFTQQILERGWTQTEVADRVNAAMLRVVGRAGRWNAEYVRKLERGDVRWPTEPYRRAIEQVFGVPVAELGFRSPRMRAGDEEDEDVRRIDFLRGLAAVGGSALLAGGLTATLNDAIVHTPVPRLVGPEHVDEVMRVATAVRSADHLGHPFAWEAMGAQVRRAIALLEAGSDRRVSLNLHAAVAALADAVGWAHFDAGQHRAADRYFRIALHCATEAGAWWLRADVLSDMARQAIYLDRADDALTLLGAAKVREDRISPLRRANLAAVQARAFGALGDVRETLRAVRDADEYFHEATTETGGEPDPDNFGDYFSFAQLNGDTAHGLYGIARAGHAVEETRHRLRVAAENYGPEWARSRAFCLALDASLALRSGEPEEGAARGLEAIDAAAGIGSARLDANIREIHAAAADLSDPSVRPLQQRAAALLAI